MLKMRASARCLDGWSYNIGRWIYILDAWDDLADDIKSGSYNAILLQFQYNGATLMHSRPALRKDLILA